MESRVFIPEIQYFMLILRSSHTIDGLSGDIDIWIFRIYGYMDIQGIFGYSGDMDIWIFRIYGYLDIQGIWIFGYSGDMDILLLIKVFRGYCCKLYMYLFNRRVPLNYVESSFKSNSRLV